MLFERRMSVKDVVATFLKAPHIVRIPKWVLTETETESGVKLVTREPPANPDDFVELTIEPDEEWLREQIQDVRAQPEAHGYPADVLLTRPSRLRYRSTRRKDDKPPRRGD